MRQRSLITRMIVRGESAGSAMKKGLPDHYLTVSGFVKFS